MIYDYDIDFLTGWILGCVIVAAIGATAVPILYSFSPWRSRRLGQLFMLQALAFAAAVDLNVIFAFWTPSNVLVMFGIEAFIFTAIAISTSALSWLMWRLNHPKKERQ